RGLIGRVARTALARRVRSEQTTNSGRQGDSATLCRIGSWFGRLCLAAAGRPGRPGTATPHGLAGLRCRAGRGVPHQREHPRERRHGDAEEPEVAREIHDQHALTIRIAADNLILPVVASRGKPKNGPQAARLVVGPSPRAKRPTVGGSSVSVLLSIFL